MHSHQEVARAQEKETARVEAFSDGVFAIAITLLILEVKIPGPANLPPGMSLWSALGRQWPSFLAYLTSFGTILIMWVNHHVLFTHIRRVDSVFLFLNGFLLLIVAFVPFPTYLLAEYLRHPQASAAAAVYAGTSVFLAVAFNLLWRYASHRHRLLGPEVGEAQVREIKRRYRFGPLLYLAAAGLAFIHVPASVILLMSLAVFFSFTGAMRK